MWGIPSWAIGVAVIMLAISLGRGLTAMFGGGMVVKRGKGDGASDAELARQAEALEEAQRRLAGWAPPSQRWPSQPSSPTSCTPATTRFLR